MFTRRKIEKKVDVIFRDMRKARSPDDVVPLLVELSEFIDGENLTEHQLEELRGIGARAMNRHSQIEFLHDFGTLISMLVVSLISGAAITGIYLISTSGTLSPMSVALLMPLALSPLYLFFYGNTEKLFT